MFTFRSLRSKVALLTLIVIMLLGSARPSWAKQLPLVGVQSPGADTYTHLPLVIITPMDMTVGKIEVTQATQTLANAVPLVASKATVARVYARVTGKDTQTDVSMRLRAYRLGSELPGSPITLSPGTAWNSGAYTNATLRADINKTFNFSLPAGWLSGNVTLIATVDPNNTIDEGSEANNDLSQAANFNAVDVLNIKVVPIKYTHTPTGKVYPAVTSPTFLESYMLAMYPVHDVNISIHATHNFSGNLTNGGTWDTLLNQITNYKSTEGLPSATVYYGVVPLDDGSGGSWFSSGVAGLGWVGYRASIGLTDWTWVPGDELAAHEIGHNFGRGHAPCNVSGEPSYPYDGGIIGQYGFKVAAFEVVDKDVKDVMGYCHPVWVSDYTYTGFYDDQTSYSMLPILPLQDSLYVRATFDENGAATLLPVYAFSARPDLPAENSPYAVEFLDSVGKVIASHPVKVYTAEEPGVQTRSVHTRLPLPTQPFTSLRLVENSQTLAKRAVSTDTLLNNAIAPTVQRDAQNATLRWGVSGAPALVRYTTDGGQTWTLLGIDLLDGELKLDLSSLPNASLRFEITLADGSNTWTLDWQP